MNFLFLTSIVIGIIGICSLIMAIGLLRGKTFTSCGCASIDYQGEKIKCPGCVDNHETPKPENNHREKLACGSIEGL